MIRRGEIDMKMIIGIILLVVGLAVALFFYSQFNWSGRADKEACHESVIYRATVPNSAEADKNIPLKCKTEKICLTAGFFGGSCDDFKGLSGITKVKVSNINDIQKTIAQNIVDCWAMMGEGRVDLFSQWFAKTYGVGSVYPSCVICSRIAFDMKGLESVGITKEKLSEMNIEEYMNTHLVPNEEITYNQLLSGDSPGKISISDNLMGAKKSQTTSSSASNPIDLSSQGITSSQQSKVPTLQELDAQIKVQTESLRENLAEAGADFSDLPSDNNLELQNKSIAILFMQMSSPTHAGAALNVGEAVGGAALASFKTAPKTTIKGFQLAAKLCTSGGWVGPAVCGAILVIAGVYQQTNIAVQRAKTAGYCGDVSTGEDARNGCSVVRTIGYNATELNQYCTSIESIQ